MAQHGIAADPEVKRRGDRPRGARASVCVENTARLRPPPRPLRRRREGCELAADAVPLCDFGSVDDGDSDEEVDDSDDDLEDSVLIRSGHARQVAWLSNIREWQEEFLGVLTAEEFVDTITGDFSAVACSCSRPRAAS